MSSTAKNPSGNDAHRLVDAPILKIGAGAWCLVACVVWTMVMLSFFLGITRLKRAHTLEIAKAQGRAGFDRDQAFRHWVASHGGLYVPVDESTQPNPYLAHVRDRDITTPSGVRLTLMNSAYATRQLQERYSERTGITEHVTSLKPMRPENAPDPWERQALKALEQGMSETTEIEVIGGELNLRLMRPMVTSTTCLTCHGQQGYKAGDIRGGVSISVPLTPLLATERAEIVSMALPLAGIWLSGLAGIGVGYVRIHHRTREAAELQRLIQVQGELAQTLSNTSNLEQALPQCLRATLEVAGLECGAIFLTEACGGTRLAAHHGASARLAEGTEKFAAGSAEDNLFRGVARYLQQADLARFNNPALITEGFRCAAILPIRHEGRVMACLTLASRSRDAVPAASRGPLEAMAQQIGPSIARLLAEAQLRQSKERYQRFFESMEDVYAEVRVPDGIIMDISPSIEAFTGHAPEELLGRPMADYYASPDDRARLLAAIKASGAVRDFEVGLRHKSGRILPASFSARLVGPTHDRPTRIVGTMRDISERKRVQADLDQYIKALQTANAALTEANAAAEAATRAKSEFLANMSHEIRTPMTAILGFADVLSGLVDQPEQLEAAATIRRNGEFLLGILDDILDLSKIEAGKFTVERIPCSPCEIVGDVLALMKVRADAKGIARSARHATPLPPTITSDPTRLRQILINLVGNAIKFTETGSVRIETSLVWAENHPAQIRFQVIDTGIGMTEGQITRVFSAFTQADTSTTRKFGGTGLGLAISQRLAEMLGGDLTVSSAAGRGSTFSVTIAAGPLEGVPLVEQPCQAGASPAPKAVSSTTNALLGSRILLAEDGPDNQRLIAHILRKAGAEVTLAKDGGEAVQKTLATLPGGDAPAAPFDIILMDVQMPVIDGHEATRRIRQAGYTGPIIALTAHAMEHHVRESLDAGCNAHSAKPIDRERLIGLLRTFLQQRLEAASAGG